MTQATDAAKHKPSLRDRAVARLTPPTRTDLGRASTSQAMAVLLQLASSPSTAPDALALLHELQVHQVELDLQAEELRHSRIELETALMHQTYRIERAPVAFLTIDASTTLHDINLAGARMLGATHDDLLGRPLRSFMSAAHVTTLLGLLDRTHEGLAPDTCDLRLMPVRGTARDVHVTAGKDSTPGQFLLVLMAST